MGGVPHEETLTRHLPEQRFKNHTHSDTNTHQERRLHKFHLIPSLMLQRCELYDQDDGPQDNIDYLYTSFRLILLR